MKTCYECGSQAEKLYWKSRCPACITRRLETNLSENDKLRAALAAAREIVETIIDEPQDPIVISFATLWLEKTRSI